MTMWMTMCVINCSGGCPDCAPEDHLPDLSKPNNHWLWNKTYKKRMEKFPYAFSILNAGLNSDVDEDHQWSIFTMYWPNIFAAALYGKE